MSFVVAIDGKAGTGKGTVTKKIAERLGFVTIDTGAMYRCVTVKVLEEKLTQNDMERIEEIANHISIEMKKVNNEQKVYLNGRDVTKEIRTTEVDKNVSWVSAIPYVREKITPLQRKMGQSGNVIMEGRDIGTVVFPNADVKIFLDASDEEIAKRRYKQNIERGMDVTYEQILEDIKRRNEYDSSREVAPLKQANDAIYIDTTKMSINEVVKEIEKIIKKKQKEIKLLDKIYAIRPETKWKNFVRKFTRGFLGGLYRIVFRVRITGSVPETGSYIICANHINYLDAAAIVLLNKRMVYFVAKEDLFRFRLLNWLAHVFDIIPIKRNMQDMEAMKRCLKVVKSGDLLGIFPEGTRKGLEKNGKAKNGAAYMAIKTGTPVIPVGIHGKFKPFSKVYVNYGEPIDLSSYKGTDKDKQNEATKLIMDNIVMLTKKES